MTSMNKGEADRDPLRHRRTNAGRDAYIGARDVTVIHHHAPEARPTSAPGLTRRIWGSVPARNLGFTGRTKLLEEVRKQLLGGERAVVQALNGMGGVGRSAAGNRVHAPVRRRLRHGVVDRRGAVHIDREGVRDAGRGAGLCPARRGSGCGTARGAG